MRVQLKSMESQKIIKRIGSSNYNPHVLLVKKPDSSIRFLIDLCLLNSKIHNIAYSYSNIDEVISNMFGNHYLSRLDISSAFYQTPLAAKSQDITAFSVGSLGTWKYLVSPMGLKSFPSILSALLQLIIGGIPSQYLSAYADYLKTHTKTYAESITVIRELFERLRAANIQGTVSFLLSSRSLVQSSLPIRYKCHVN